MQVFLVIQRKILINHNTIENFPESMFFVIYSWGISPKLRWNQGFFI